MNRTPAAASLAPLGSPASSTPRVVMHAPSSTGGHPLYVQELLTALVRHPQGGDRFELMTSVDLEPQFRTAAYPINDVLPVLRHKREFPNRLSWAWNRLTYYTGRDRMFLDWCAARPEVRGVHLQEFSVSMRRMVRGLQRMGTSVFYTVHNIRPHAYPHFVPRALWDKLNRDACNACDRLIVHTERLRDDLAEFLGKGHPPIDVAPHGVWSGNAEAGQQPPAMADRMALKRLLFFGTIRRNKGLDVLLDAAEALRDEFTITIAGEAREGEYFRYVVKPRVEQLRSKGVSIDLIDRFIPESEVADIFNRHSVLLLPYTSEFTAQSGVVFLALAHAIPVVASEAGGMRDLFAEHRIGTTFAEHTPAAFAAAVRKCFDASQVAPAELSANLAAARERFSWRSAAEATLASYAAGFMSRSEERGSSRGVGRREPLSSYAQDVKGETSNDRGFATIAAHQHTG